ncbi:MAG: undecaprenyl-diphosphate phosphatase [Synergistaceae bacterium]|jgi:undecaprenyl-diphosphatase|nr:undecaprenyl-diphosphate phosphatase [Synergistaceae bacterium]
MNAQSIMLGLVQGLTEFLPVSSSGHLGLAKAAMGVGDMTIAYDVTLHVATVLAVIIFFARDLISLLGEWFYGFFNKNARNWDGWRFGWAVIVGSAVTCPLGIMLAPYAEAASANTLWISCGFWITGLLLASARFITEGDKKIRIIDGAFVGFVQGLAVMPGVSRSGTTIWAGSMAGLSREDAFKFSFLLSVPAIVGATFFEARKLGGYDAFLLALPDGWLQGAVIAFLTGLASLLLLRKLVLSDRWWLFSVYCMLMGAVSVIFSLVAE